MSSREGASGYFVVFVAGGGGVVGFALGLAVARAVVARHGPGFLLETGAALGVVLALAGLAALVWRLLGDVAPTIDGRDLELEVELRFPLDDASAPPTAKGAWSFELASVVAGTRRDVRTDTVDRDDARREDGRWIVPARVPLFTEREKRAIRLQSGVGDACGFPVPLPARPGTAFEAWSAWLPREEASGRHGRAARALPLPRAPHRTTASTADRGRATGGARRARGSRVRVARPRRTARGVAHVGCLPTPPDG